MWVRIFLVEKKSAKQLLKNVGKIDHSCQSHQHSTRSFLYEGVLRRFYSLRIWVCNSCGKRKSARMENINVGEIGYTS